MVSLRALLVGDIASLHFPAGSGYVPDQDGQDHHDSGSDDGVRSAEERQKDLRYAIDRSFGKVREIVPPEETKFSSSSSSPQHPTGESGRELRYLQLSLEEAFYLAHVDKCLALAVPRVAVSATKPTALPLSPLEKRLPHDDCDSAGGGPETGEIFGAGCELSGCDGGGALPLLTSEEAWRYCCNRRSDFPAMFAVYRHFRERGYVVHTGHKYGAHFVLYEGSPEECHSRYCVHVMGGGGGGGDSWAHMKTVTRLMPDVAKCLLVCGVTYGGAKQPSLSEEASLPPPISSDTSSLAALALAEVSALRFARSREPDDGSGGKSANTREARPTVLKVRPAQSAPRGRNRRGKQARKLTETGGEVPQAMTAAGANVCEMQVRAPDEGVRDSVL